MKKNVTNVTFFQFCYKNFYFCIKQAFDKAKENLMFRRQGAKGRSMIRIFGRNQSFARR